MRAIILLSWWQLKNGLLTILRNVWLTLLLILTCGSIIWGLIRLPHLFEKSAGTVNSLSDFYLMPYLVQIQAGIFAGVIALSSLGFVALLSGAALQFSLPDVYYLFPSPLSRRLVLLAKMPLYIVGVFWATVSFFWIYDLLVFAQVQPYLDPGFALRSQIFVFLSVFLCIATYANLVLSLEIVLGVENIAVYRRIMYPMLGLLFAGITVLSFRKGMDGLIPLARQPVIEAVFYPCYLAARAAIAPFHQKIDGWAVIQLAVFFSASLAVLFSRRENYYETALRGSEAVAERRAAQTKGEYGLSVPGLRRRSSGRDYTLPAFGRGAGAVAWAHLSAAAKQPYANFLTPLIVGAAPFVMTHFIPDMDTRDAIVIGSVIAFTMLTSLIGNANIVQAKAIALQPLVRPFPVPPRLVVLADLAPLIVNAALVGLGGGTSALVLHVGPSPWKLAAVSVTCLPAVLICIYMQCHLFALLATATQDKLRPWLINTAGYLVTNVLFSLLAGVLFASVALDVPLPISIANCLYACFVFGAVFLALSERAYRKYEPGQ